MVRVLNLFLTMCSVLLPWRDLAMVDHFLPPSSTSFAIFLSSVLSHLPLNNSLLTASYWDLNDWTTVIGTAFPSGRSVCQRYRRGFERSHSTCWQVIYHYLKLSIPHDLQQQSWFLLLPAAFAACPLAYQFHRLVFQDALLLLENGWQLLPLLLPLPP